MSHLLDLRTVLGSRPLFSVGAGVCVLDHTGRLLLQRRSDDGRWGLPGGSADLGEALVEVARRELREETGLDLPAEALRVLEYTSGPALYHRYPNGDEVYYVGAVYVANLAAGFELPAHDDPETLELAFFDLDGPLPPLSGPTELLALRALRREAGLEPSEGPPVLRTPPEPGPGYLRVLRTAMGTAPIFAVGASVLVLDDATRVLLQRRADGSGWGLPGGASELGEHFEETARRELREGSGIEASSLEMLDLLMGPEFFHRSPHGDEIYDVSALHLARVPSGVVPEVPSGESGAGETLELRVFPLDAVPEDLAGPVTREALRRARGLGRQDDPSAPVLTRTIEL